MNEKEMQVILRIADGMMGRMIPCTACRYCTTHCPKQLDIPELLEIYNNNSFAGLEKIPQASLKNVAKEKWPSECVGCRSCEKVCPQQIKISEVMKEFAGKVQE